MGDLTNKQIDQTYDGLIKTSDEQPIDGTLKNLQDGVGNDLPIQVSNTTVNFTGTVTGIPGGTDTTYDLGVVDTGDAEIRLVGSDATTDTVTLVGGANVSLDVSQDTITINSAGGTDTNTTYDLDFVPDGNNATIELNGSDATTDTISIVPGNNVTFDLGTPGEFTINAAGAASAVSSLNLLDGDLTLTAGSGISITDDGNTDITITATGGGGGSSTNSYQDAYKPQVLTGWDPTGYYFTSRPVLGGLGWQPVNDQGPGSIQMGWLYVEPGKAINEIAVPIRNIGLDHTVEFGLYDTYPSGSPKDLVFSDTVSVLTANNVNGSQYAKKTFATPFIPTQGMYYFAFRSLQSNNPNEYDNVLTVLSRFEVPINVVNILPSGGEVNNMYQSGVIQTNVGGPLPATWDENYGFAEREEQLILLFR